MNESEQDSKRQHACSIPRVQKVLGGKWKIALL